MNHGERRPPAKLQDKCPPDSDGTQRERERRGGGLRFGWSSKIDRFSNKDQT